MRLLALAALAVLIAGCLEDGAGPRPSADVAATAESHVAAFLSGDVENTLRFYADPSVDLGGGDPCDRGREEPAANATTVTTQSLRAQQEPSAAQCTGDGANVTLEERREMLTGFFGSSDFDAFRGKAPRDLLDFDLIETKACAPGTDACWSNGWFEHHEGDVQVHVPPREGSPLFDGWFGVYRMMDGAWTYVAGD